MYMKTTDLMHTSFPFDAEFKKGGITAHTIKDAVHSVIKAEKDFPFRITHKKDETFLECNFSVFIGNFRSL
jgi:phage tail sheath gpL-like